MSAIKVIITGATGMVGEGVLFECLNNDAISEVLIVSRSHYELQHAKLKELLVKDFFQLDEYEDELRGYDACFFCAGVSSLGMDKEKYEKLTYDTTLAFAKKVSELNPNMVFTYVSGAHTDSTETSSRLHWARVKGKTENDLNKLPFKAEYNFRPGIIQPFPSQKNWKSFVKVMVKVVKFFAPKSVVTLHELGLAMIRTVTEGYPKNVLEIADIKKLAGK